eukprot:Nk52_evm14s2309 gene=Nk52_evmTU14s2309
MNPNNRISFSPHLLLILLPALLLNLAPSHAAPVPLSDNMRLANSERTVPQEPYNALMDQAYSPSAKGFNTLAAGTANSVPMRQTNWNPGAFGMPSGVAEFAHDWNNRDYIQEDVMKNMMWNSMMNNGANYPAAQPGMPYYPSYPMQQPPYIDVNGPLPGGVVPNPAAMGAGVASHAVENTVSQQTTNNAIVDNGQPSVVPMQPMVGSMPYVIQPLRMERPVLHVNRQLNVENTYPIRDGMVDVSSAMPATAVPVGGASTTTMSNSQGTAVTQGNNPFLGAFYEEDDQQQGMEKPQMHPQQPQQQQVAEGMRQRRSPYYNGRDNDYYDSEDEEDAFAMDDDYDNDDDVRYASDFDDDRYSDDQLYDNDNDADMYDDGDEGAMYDDDDEDTMYDEDMFVDDSASPYSRDRDAMYDDDDSDGMYDDDDSASPYSRDRDAMYDDDDSDGMYDDDDSASPYSRDRDAMYDGYDRDTMYDDDENDGYNSDYDDDEYVGARDYDSIRDTDASFDDGDDDDEDDFDDSYTTDWVRVKDSYKRPIGRPRSRPTYVDVDAGMPDYTAGPLVARYPSSRRYPFARKGYRNY